MSSHEYDQALVELDLAKAQLKMVKDFANEEFWRAYNKLAENAKQGPDYRYWEGYCNLADSLLTLLEEEEEVTRFTSS